MSESPSDLLAEVKPVETTPVEEVKSEEPVEEAKPEEVKTEEPVVEAKPVSVPVNEVIIPKKWNAPPAHKHNKIILLLMIKNESKIIQRCLQHALPHVDAVAILDTGSTDNTVELCTQFLTPRGKPFKIAVEPFKTFGYNRTVSFQNAQALCTELGWDAEKTYAMAVDADMNIQPAASFKDFQLTSNGYTVIQSNGNLKYYNTRFMKCGHPWKCVGATHEYWSGDPTSKIPNDVFYIDDKNDGGCKSDKFERDVRLLTEEVKEDPNNPRAHFYLGQSLKDLGRFKESIVHYKRRIEIGGWREEVWYSHYQIAKCYELMKDPLKMELWMNKAFQYHSTRAEPLYYLTRYFREKSDHYKSYHYYLKGRHIPYPKDDVLFIEDQVYNGMFEYENTILACYVAGKTRQDSLLDVVNYINNGTPHYIHNVWDNLHYYTEPLTSSTYKGEYMRLPFKDFEEYKVSSCSILPYSSTDPNRRFIMNTRYVNYSIDEKGLYHMRDPNQHVKTRNGVTFLNESGYPTEDVKMIKEEMQSYPSNIFGLEDVRLFWQNGRLRFSASSKNIVNNGHIVIAVGDYIPDQQRITNVSVVHGPYTSECEKNWIAVPSTSLTHIEAAKGKLNFIYGWGPMEIGAVKQLPDGKQKLEIHTKYTTPHIFNRFRGSSPLCEYNGALYCVVHFVKYASTRHYYHSVIRFNRDTLRPEAYALPFSFCDPKIEYCVGFHIKDGLCWFVFSRNDCDPSMIRAPLANLRMLSL